MIFVPFYEKFQTFVQLPRSFSAVEEARQLEFNSVTGWPFSLSQLECMEVKYHLKGLFDTGGCCNMGRKEYHLQIAASHAQLVKRVINLNNTIQIGGIKNSVETDTLIKYYLPFTNAQYDHHTLMIGLTDDLPVGLKNTRQHQ